MRMFRYAQRMEYFHKRILKTEHAGRRQSGARKRRFMDVVREDMQIIGLREEDADDREIMRRMSCADSC